MTEQDTVDLSGCFLWDSQQKKRVKLDQAFSRAELIRRLTDEWIPYFECDQCGRVDYCKFTEPHPTRVGRKLDIQCGVVRKAIQSLVDATFSELVSASRKRQQAYLDGAFFFSQFVYEAELQIANLLDDSIIRYHGSYAPMLFGFLVNQRRNLDGVARHWKIFPSLRARQTVLLVEGKSEMAFLQRLRQSQLAFLLDLDVISYGGNGNRRPGKLKMLLDRFEEDGYTVYMQGDADGEHRDTFEALKRDLHIPKERVFSFKNDFESSVPTELMIRAIGAIAPDVDVVNLKAVLAAATEPASVVLRKTVGRRFLSGKVQLAHAIADALNRSSWLTNKHFMATELGLFLAFIQEMRA